MYRWVRKDPDGGQWLLVDPDYPDAIWGAVDRLDDGDWFATFPPLGSSRFSTLEAAQWTVQSAQGFDPSEVER